jgi:hypothetical protein
MYIVPKIKTHCVNGHEFNEKNTYRSKRGRHCRICNNVASKKHQGYGA